MKKEIRLVDPGRHILSVTTVDERFYAREALDPVTGLPTYEYVPSVTWIAGYYPKGVGFYKWLANHGWDEATAIREAAADKGSKIHQACADLIDGKTLAYTSEYANPSTGEREPLTLDEWEAAMAFRDFWAVCRPEAILRDHVVWGDGFAGTLDFLGTLVPDDEGRPADEPRSLWLIDFKTGHEVWPEHHLQVTAYREALFNDPPAAAVGERFTLETVPLVRLGILQLGYRKNKRGWKLTEVAPCPELFEAARLIWARECDGEAPRQVDYPLELTLAHGEPAPPKKRRKVRA